MAAWFVPRSGDRGKGFGKSAGPGSPDMEYEPVYGLSRRAVKEWLARNPRFKPVYEAALRERISAVRSGGA